MKYNYDIIIIDSGVDVNNKVFEEITINKLCLRLDENNNLIEHNKFVDTIGHGTAVFSIIKKRCSDANILNIKIFDDEMQIEEMLLIKCLKYIYKNITSKIIHISAGITASIYKKSLERICNKIYKSGTVIICAFDNYGALSYPAAFNSVIGVELSHSCKKTNEYIYIENSPVNMRVFGLNQKVPWKNNQYFSVCSNSFAAPHATCIIYNILKTECCELEHLKNSLKTKAKNVLNLPLPYLKKTDLKIKKAIVLPYNKEIHSILRYISLLKFEIIGFYDHPKLESVNRALFKSVNDKILFDSWDNINWNAEFDTVIIGHMRLINDLFQTDYLEHFIEKCMKYNKNIFCFDSLEKYETCDLKNYKNRYYYPHVNSNEIKNNWMLKLPEISIPIIAVFGTSKKQGKFTLQLELRKNFLNLGYKVGQLGTEPSSDLFGFDDVFPMGYDSTIKTYGIDSIATIRNMMLQIENKNKDIIIVGGQSQTIPITYNNCLAFPLYNYDFCIGTNPDVIILVVNLTDDFDYIIKTINFLQSTTEGKVVSVVISSVLINDNWSVIGNKLEVIPRSELEQHKKLLKDELKINVFLFDEVDCLVENIINYLT